MPQAMGDATHAIINEIIEEMNKKTRVKKMTVVNLMTRIDKLTRMMIGMKIRQGKDWKLSCLRILRIEGWKKSL